MNILRELRDAYQYRCAPRHKTIREITEFSFQVEQPESMTIQTACSERNAALAAYTQKEFSLYADKTNKVEDFAEASNFWRKIANPDGTVNSAYGHLIWAQASCGNTDFSADMRTPWAWAKQALREDKDTRQAILRFSLPSHQWVGNKDFTCTMHGQFYIREDKLHFSVVMRSNDAVRGLAYDMPWFIHLMDKMIEELAEIYPQLSKGTYTHYAHSMHIYEDDLSIVDKMLGA